MRRRRLQRSLDAVIATTYGVDSEGVYTGELDGTYVWSRGKRDAVRAWSQENDVDLSGSYAYSDSVFDEPLLAAVGFKGIGCGVHGFCCR